MKVLTDSGRFACLMAIAHSTNAFRKRTCTPRVQLCMPASVRQRQGWFTRIVAAGQPAKRSGRALFPIRAKALLALLMYFGPLAQLIQAQSAIYSIAFQSITAAAHRFQRLLNVHHRMLLVHERNTFGFTLIKNISISKIPFVRYRYVR